MISMTGGKWNMKLINIKGTQMLGKQLKAQKAEFYVDLKKTGFTIEQQLNQRFQNLLNNEDLVKLANGHIDLLTNKFKTLQNSVEVLFTILQIPTKNDVANVAKLILQTEEKVDNLEEQILKLTEAVEKVISKDDIQVMKVPKRNV